MRTGSPSPTFIMHEMWVRVGTHDDNEDKLTIEEPAAARTSRDPSMMNPITRPYCYFRLELLPIGLRVE